jgi:hypothetical protein
MCGAPAEEADHKYVLRGWTDAGRAWMPLEADPQSRSAGQRAKHTVSTAAGPALVSLNFYKICHRHLRRSGPVRQMPARPNPANVAEYWMPRRSLSSGSPKGATRWRGMTAEVRWRDD